MKLSAGKIWHLMAKVRNYAYVLLVATALSYANPYSFSNSLRHVFFIAALAAFILLFSGTVAKNRWEYFHNSYYVSVSFCCNRYTANRYC